jgi:hypothetical protein
MEEYIQQHMAPEDFAEYNAIKEKMNLTSDSKAS